ncbi:hypothetical protein BDY19DRAFT_911062 [Irpex rosettiformis]|uniref:Uncharacterized protein n=1 Tax=Irpex rosettiformis TaxID=378272 RepID=A0ACB8UIC4_9APHY|nr:hypothetical protein BDY19DRAFT_911062 [Irpex rosettiformis]
MQRFRSNDSDHREATHHRAESQDGPQSTLSSQDLHFLSGFRGYLVEGCIITHVSASRETRPSQI